MALKNGSGVVVVDDGAAQLAKDISFLTGNQVLIGVPEERTDREAGDPLTNAALAYIHDQGAPEAGIPQREFMRPGIESVRDQLAARLGAAGRALTRPDIKPDQARRLCSDQLNAAGLIAASAVRKKIDSGIPPPLKDATLRRRAARIPSRKAERAELQQRREDREAGLNVQALSTERVSQAGSVKPLIDTGEMRKSISYVIRRRARG